MLRCNDGIGMLVESHVSGLEKLCELIAVPEPVKTARPADENVFTETRTAAGVSASPGLSCAAHKAGTAAIVAMSNANNQ